MPEPVDALAGLLAELQRAGSVPASRLSERSRQRLDSLFQAEVVVAVAAGAGRRIELRSATPLAAFIAKHYPKGLFRQDTPLPPKAAAVASRRSAHRARRGDCEPVLVRGFGELILSKTEVSLAVAELTRLCGCAAITVGEEEAPWLCGAETVVTVENLELFYRIEQFLPEAVMAVYAAGRMSRRLLDWLVRLSRNGAHIIHAGDYDPIGLAEYLRLKKAGIDASFFLPEQVPALFADYADPALLKRRNTQRLLAPLRRSSDPQVVAVMKLIDTHGAGLEQEALLVDAVS